MHNHVFGLNGEIDKQKTNCSHKKLNISISIRFVCRSMEKARESWVEVAGIFVSLDIVY